MSKSFNADHLISAIQLMKNCYDSKTSLPIIERLFLKDEKLIVTDLESTAVLDFPVKGEGLVLFSEFEKIIKRFKSKTVEIEVVGDRMLFKLGLKRFDIEFVTENSQDFPQIPFVEREERQVNDRDKMIMKAVPSFLGRDELRPVMTGVYLSENGKAVATDTHRLFFMDMQQVFDFKGGIICPAKFVKTFNAAIKKTELTYQFGLTEDSSSIRYVGFRAQSEGINISFLFREIDGRYPNWEAVVPQDGSKLLLNTKELIEAIGDALVTANKDTKQIRLDVNDAGVVISSRDLDFNTGFRKDMEFEGKLSGCKEFPISIGFNGNFMLDILNSTQYEDGTYTLLNMIAPNRAIKINECTILMPVMLSE